MLKYDERLRGSSMQRRLEEDEDEEEEEIREIHALTPPRAPPAQHSRRSSSISMASTEAASSSMENFTSMSREFSALVLAGSTINSHTHNYNNTHVHVDDIERSGNLGRIREEEEETNPLAIVPDHNPLIGIGSVGSGSRGESDRVTVTTSSSVQRVKKEEVEAKISAWQNAKVAKINNRFKREVAVITAWETDHAHKATSSMSKVERKLEEKRARALEKMQNDIAKARRKGEERKASAEGKRGTKVARVLEIANLMRAVGKYPAKRSFF